MLALGWIATRAILERRARFSSKIRANRGGTALATMRFRRSRAMEIRFWGVRGSIASPGPETASVGGNTSCVEVMCGAQRIVLDAGTGLRALGNALVATREPQTLALL